MSIIDLGDGRFMEEVTGHFGLNLRQDRVQMADGDLARATNVDVHTQPGTLMLRKGRRKQFTTPLDDLRIRRLAKVADRRYRVANLSVYRDVVRIIGGLSLRQITTIVGYRPLNDATEWAFIADDALMRKDDGTNVRIWGITGPGPSDAATTATGDAGVLTGVYRVKYTYVRKSGSSVAHESNPSPASNATTLATQQLAISTLAVSSDPQVTHKRIYRTVAGGALYLYDQEVTNATTTATSTQADSALGAEVETDNDPPPTAAWAWEYNGHIWLTNDQDNPHLVYWSKRFRPESFPPDNFLEIGNPSDPLQCGVSIAGLCGIFSQKAKYRIVGNDTSGYVPMEAISSRGVASPNAAVATERGVLFVAHDGIFLTNFIAPDEDISQALAPMFLDTEMYGQRAIDFSAATHMAVEAYKGRLYVAVPIKPATPTP